MTLAELRRAPYLSFYATATGTVISGLETYERRQPIKTLLSAVWNKERSSWISRLTLRQIGLILYPTQLECPDLTELVRQISSYGESVGHIANIYIHCRPNETNGVYSADGWMFLTHFNSERRAEIEKILAGVPYKFKLDTNYD